MPQTKQNKCLMALDMTDWHTALATEKRSTQLLLFNNFGFIF